MKKRRRNTVEGVIETTRAYPSFFAEAKKAELEAFMLTGSPLGETVEGVIETTRAYPSFFAEAKKSRIGSVYADRVSLRGDGRGGNRNNPSLPFIFCGSKKRKGKLLTSHRYNHHALAAFRPWGS